MPLKQSSSFMCSEYALCSSLTYPSQLAIRLIDMDLMRGLSIWRDWAIHQLPVSSWRSALSLGLASKLNKAAACVPHRIDWAFQVLGLQGDPTWEFFKANSIYWYSSGRRRCVNIIAGHAPCCCCGACAPLQHICIHLLCKMWVDTECICIGHAAGQDEPAGAQVLAEESATRHHKGAALLLWIVMLDTSGSQRILLALQTHAAGIVFANHKWANEEAPGYRTHRQAVCTQVQS